MQYQTKVLHLAFQQATRKQDRQTWRCATPKCTLSTEQPLIKARTLKNRLADKAFESENEDDFAPQYAPVNAKDLKVGAKVFVNNLHQEGIVQNIRPQKEEAEILCGSIRIRSKISELSVVITQPKAQPKTKSAKWKKNGVADNVQVTKSLKPKPASSLEINVIGLTVHEAIPEVEGFLDAAVISNLEEVRIVHGMGTGKLRAGIHDFLRTHRSVAQFRLGKYGEGDTGVTIVKLK